MRFEPTEGGLKRALIATPLAEAELYTHGAHIARWTPRGHRPVLYLSSKTLLAPGKPIRGGVPVIFPWFGPRSDGQPGPAHGFARTAEWTVESTAEDEATLTLEVAPYSLRFHATFGTELTMALEATNNGPDAVRFEEALHTYFAVSDIHQVSVHGLEGATYIDKTDAFTRKVQSAEPIRFAKETDSVYLNTAATCVIEDPAWNRRISIAKTGSQTTVVWNPWIAKAATLGDLDPAEWPRFVCVETANAADNAVTLQPFETHSLKVSIVIE